MRIASLDLSSLAEPRVVCMGAHCDDIEIGCGATLAKIAKSVPNAHFHFVVFCADNVRSAESTAAINELMGESSTKSFEFLGMRDGYLPYSGANAKDALRKLASSLQPDLVFTHYNNDAHQDHRFVSEITANEFRNQLTLEYEIPKYDGDLGNPNVYVSLSETEISHKVDVLLEHFPSQSEKHWFTKETFLALSRLRGIEAGASRRYAEAFYCRKLVLEFC